MLYHVKVGVHVGAACLLELLAVDEVVKVLHLDRLMVMSDECDSFAALDGDDTSSFGGQCDHGVGREVHAELMARWDAQHRVGQRVYHDAPFDGW